MLKKRAQMSAGWKIFIGVILAVVLFFLIRSIWKGPILGILGG